MKNNKKVLLIVATHGDEKIGIEVIKELKKKGYEKWFDYIIANPRALRKNVRFIDKDLNRSYPGNKYSRFYEERKAYDNLKKARKYRYIIDIHEADKGMDNFIIIPKEKLRTSFPVELINLKKLLLWPDPKGPISQILDNTIELEFGMKNKNRAKIIKKAVKIVENFIIAVNNSKNYPAKFSFNTSKKQVYYVYGRLLSQKTGKIPSNLRDFRKTQIGSEKFYPLLVRQYLNNGILCYKMRKMR